MELIEYWRDLHNTLPDYKVTVQYWKKTQKIISVLKNYLLDSLYFFQIIKFIINS